MPTEGSKKSSFVCDIVQTDSWVVSYPRKLVIAFGARPTFGGEPPKPPEHARGCRKG